MKLKDVLNEGVTDVVARFYKEAGEDFDKFYNKEDVDYKQKTEHYYDEHFKSWFNEEIVPVFTKPTDNVQPPFTNKPDAGKLQSPGYRGQQYAKARADMPYDHKVQRYEPNAPAIMATYMDGARNNNGN